MSTLLTRAQAPAFRLGGADGKQYSLKEALVGGPVLAAFFKVGCPTCQYAFPFIERIYQQFGGMAATIWGVSQDNAGDTRQFAKKYGVSFPLLIDENHYATSRAYTLKYTPTIFLISPEGRIELHSEGFVKSNFLEIQRRVAEYLHLKASPLLFQPSEKIPEYKPG